MAKASVEKKKTLFNHLTAITQYQDPKYWDTLSESDKKTWSNYMVLRFISMNPDWVELVSLIQPFVQEIHPKMLYLVLIGTLPKTKRFLKYTKADSADKYETWLVDLVSRYYEVSKLEAEDYLLILYSTSAGHAHIKKLCEIYGTEPKEIKKLKLKL